MPSNIIENITFTSGITLINLYGVGLYGLCSSEIFKSFADAGIDVDMISQTPGQGGGSTLSFTFADGDTNKALTVLSELRSKYMKLVTTICSGNLAVTFNGRAMPGSPGIAAGVLDSFKRAGVDALLITTSSISISVLTAKSDEMAVTRLLSEYGIKE